MKYWTEPYTGHNLAPIEIAILMILGAMGWSLLDFFVSVALPTL